MLLSPSPSAPSRLFPGPYMQYDPATKTQLPVFTAKPVPGGVTVIATPKLPPGAQAHQIQVPPTAPGAGAGSPPQSPVPAAFNPNPNAAPFYPESAEGSPTSSSSPSPPPPSSSSASAQPHFMYWSAAHPEGTLIPLRQPQPPVYFAPPPPLPEHVEQQQQQQMAVQAN